jgi:hypothetical protein
MSIDIKDFYLCTPMKRYEYFRMKIELFPEDIIQEYDLRNKVDAKGNVHCEVRRGMYGLPQAGIIAQELLEERLLKAGYRQSKVIPRYWKNDWQPVSFTLVVVVDNFGVKYINQTDVNHLIQTLKQDYKSEDDWEGTRYLGITLDWDYKKREVHLSMPGYAIRTSYSQTTSTSTSQTYCSHLRSHHSIRQRRQCNKPTFERREEIRPTSSGHFSLLRPSSRTH